MRWSGGYAGHYSVRPGTVDSDDWSALVVACGGSDTSWTGRFLELVHKSDPGNRARLRRAAPELVEAWEAWMAHADGHGAGVTAARVAMRERPEHSDTGSGT